MVPDIRRASRAPWRMPPFRSMACRSPTRKAVAGPTLTCAVGMETPERFIASTGAADPRLMRCGVPGMGPSTFLEEIVRRDRLLLLAGILGVSALAWGWLILGSGMDMSAIEMTRMAGMDGWMMQQAMWTPAYALLIVSMWWVMMLAMMLPGAAPMLLLFAQVNRKAVGSPFMPTGTFATGYLIAWGGFSVVATGLQWALESTRLMSPMLQIPHVWDRKGG